MADEIKEGTEAKATDAAPKKKRNWKAKRLPIVIAAVVVVTVLGVAGWAWRATPEYCDTLCHSTMGRYYDSFVNDTTSLAYAHKGVVNNQCLGCHEQTLSQSMHQTQAQLAGSYSEPFEKVVFSNDFCLQSGCHTGGGVMPGATESSTADYPFDPHSTYHGVQQCNSCHLMHDQSVFTCASCHQVGAWEGEGGVPDGWVVMELGDGKTGGVPDGWTTPMLVQQERGE